MSETTLEGTVIDNIYVPRKAWRSERRVRLKEGESWRVRLNGGPVRQEAGCVFLFLSVCVLYILFEKIGEKA